MTNYNFVALKKSSNGHTYLLAWDEDSHIEAIGWPIRWWKDREFDFNFEDAKAMSKAVCRETSSA